MVVRQLAMVTAQVRDLDSMVAWYRDVLQLSVQWSEPGEFCSLVASDGGGVVALATDHPERISERPGVGWTPTFSVDDFDATVAFMKERGVAFDAEEEGTDEGYRLVRVRDPEGNVVAITA